MNQISFQNEKIQKQNRIFILYIFFYTKKKQVVIFYAQVTWGTSNSTTKENS